MISILLLRFYGLHIFMLNTTFALQVSRRAKRNRFLNREREDITIIAPGVNVVIFCTVILFLSEKYCFEEKQKPNYHSVAAQIILIILQQLQITTQRSNFCFKLNNFHFSKIGAHSINLNSESFLE